MLFWQLVQYLHLYGLSTLCDFVASVYVDNLYSAIYCFVFSINCLIDCLGRGMVNYYAMSL